MMEDYGKLPPRATAKLTPFRARVDDAKLHQFEQLVKLSPIGPAVFENTNAGRTFGMRRDWLAKAKRQWETEFNWRLHEDRINSFPNFMASLTDSDGNDVALHFIALFSEKADAIPVMFLHGWPGSFLEFLGLLDILKKRYSPGDLPYHIVVPSLPGYAYSTGPPLEKDYGLKNAADALNHLMLGLGFVSGYLAQGGDIGSFVSRELATNHGACKGIHVNMGDMRSPGNASELHIDMLEEKTLSRITQFFETDCAYALEHGTRTATIGLALSASPIALLSWIGEKFLEWTDEDPLTEQILESVSLYFLTDTFPRCLYPYRGNGSDITQNPNIASVSGFCNSQRKTPYIDKPSGYSSFAHEILPMPKSAAATSMDLVSYSQHARGGHFAAMEQPELLLRDVEEWIKKAWK